VLKLISLCLYKKTLLSLWLSVSMKTYKFETLRDECGQAIEPCSYRYTSYVVYIYVVRVSCCPGGSKEDALHIKEHARRQGRADNLMKVA